MQFRLEINCDNAAFGEPEQDSTDLLDEIARILQTSSQLVADGCVSDHALRDINGNTVGSFELVGN